MGSRSARRPVVVAAILLSMFLSAMEATVVATAMPTVIAELHGIELYGWVGAIYMLATTVTIPLWGKLADVVGRKPILLAGMGVFLLGSMGSGLARSMLMLIVLRAVQGVGAGALQPVALTIVGDLFTVAERGRIQGVFGAVWGVAGMVGPLVGGFVVAVASWRWVFFLNLPFGLLSATLLVLFYREQREPSGGAKTSPAGRLPIDVLGALLLSLAVPSLLLGAGGRAPLVMLPLAMTLLVSFVLWERRAADPLLPLPLLARPPLRVASILGALLGAVLVATLMYTPLYMQSVLHKTPTEAGASVAPMFIGWPLASATSGRLLSRVGYRPLVRTGTFVIAVSAAAIAFLVVAGPRAVPTLTFALGVGMGLTNTALLIAVQESVVQRERGVATASTMFFRNIGGAISVGALGALVGWRLVGKIPGDILDRLLGVERGKGIASELLACYQGAIGGAMRPVFVVVASLAALSFIVAMAFPKAVRRPEEADRPA